MPAHPIARRELLADGVYAELRELIVLGEIPPSERLNIEVLSRKLEVSPTPVREALARLESENLVTKLPLKGYVTTDLYRADEIRDLYELRFLLEVPSAGSAASKATPSQVAELDDEMTVGEKLSSSSGTRRSLIDHDARFHFLVLDIAGNKAIRRAFEGTNCHLHLYRLSHQAFPGETNHSDIAAAIRSGDTVGAEESMREHLTQARDRTLAVMQDAAASAPESLLQE